MKYFRLLEKGEPQQEDDLYIGTGSSPADVCRPVTVDEFHDYSKVKPTKEDFEPTGLVQVYSAATHPMDRYRHVSQDFNFTNVIHWRRITPPERPKPKSVKVKICCLRGEVHADGTATIHDSSHPTVLPKEQIDAFIAARQEVMKQ